MEGDELAEYVRVTIGKMNENIKCIRELEEIIKAKRRLSKEL